jgi:hypothetical protein
MVSSDLLMLRMHYADRPVVAPRLFGQRGPGAAIFCRFPAVSSSEPYPHIAYL